MFVKKTKILLLSLTIFSLIPSYSAKSEVLLFNGRGDYQNNSILGVKIFRGSEAQQYHERLYQSYLNSQAKKDPNAQIAIKSNDGNSFAKEYSLSNIDGVQSVLSINEDGTFYWSMKYDKTYLNTKGNWTLNKSDNTLNLDTDPKPKDIMFKYVKQIEDAQGDETDALNNGDLHITVQQSKGDAIETRGLKDISVSCIGMYGGDQTTTDDKGNATCHHVGYPIRKLVLKAKDLSNATYWLTPKIEGSHWLFDFDMFSAHTDYQFDHESFVIQDGGLSWNGRSLGATKNWIYK